MKKLLMLILLFVIACSRQNENPEIKPGRIIVIEDKQKEDLKTTKYNEKKKEEK